MNPNAVDRAIVDLVVTPVFSKEIVSLSPPEHEQALEAIRFELANEFDGMN